MSTMPPIDAALRYLTSGKVYFFGGEDYIRFEPSNDRADIGYPKRIQTSWPGVPFNKIDAALWYKQNSMVYFFSDDEYVRFNPTTNRVDPDYPKKIRTCWPGVPFDKIDAALWYDTNNVVYFFSGDQYVRFNPTTNRVDPGYPKNTRAHWEGVPFDRIDAALWYDTNNMVYLFSEDQYVRFNPTTDRVDPGYPRAIAGNWELYPPFPPTETKLTPFNVNRHGFEFANDYETIVYADIGGVITIPEFRFNWRGRCGGMTYAALDYFSHNMAVPAKNTVVHAVLAGFKLPEVPQDGTKLGNFIWKRLWDSFGNIGTQVVRRTDPNHFIIEQPIWFNAGCRGGSDFEQVKSKIDADSPINLVLVALGGGFHFGECHQVLAIGYSVGRESRAHEVEIFLYDPNYPKKNMVLVPSIQKNMFEEYEIVSGTTRTHRKDWMNYIPDVGYQPVQPPNVNPSLPEDWSGINRDHANLEGRDMRSYTLRHTHLNRASMERCDLSNLNMASSVDAYHAHFQGANLRYSCLIGMLADDARFDLADLRAATLMLVQAKRANFEDANLGDANCTSADLTNAKFNGRTALQNADFTDATLRGADLSGSIAGGDTSMRNADLSGAVLNDGDYADTKFNGATLTGAWLVNLKTNMASFEDVKAQGAHFEHANLLSANFKKADLTGAFFNNAQLHNADFTQAEVAGCSWIGAVAPNAVGLSPAIIHSMAGDPDITMLPTSFSAGLDAVLDYGGAVAYLFKGSQYVRYPKPRHGMPAQYPKSISGAWPGLWTSGIDAAINWGNGKVYVFKGSQYVQYDIAADRVDSGYPLTIGGRW